MADRENSERRQILKAGAAVLTGAAIYPSLGAKAAEQEYVIAQPLPTTINVSGSEARFPVRRVYCLGRNFRAHAIESGDDPDTSPPFFFMKPTDAITPADRGFPYPALSNNVEFEMEMLVALGRGGKNIPESSALDYVYGYGVGLDMTRRDLQSNAKSLRRPWEAGKSFDQSAPCGPLYPATQIGHPNKGRIWLSVNGDIKQDSDIAKMRWSIQKSISVLSQYFELAAGDIILAGTPEGVGPIERGDVIRGGIDGVGDLEVRVL